MVNGESTYQCDCCRMKQRVGRSDDIAYPARPKPDYGSDIVARSSLDVNLHAQLESIRTNGECTTK